MNAECLAVLPERLLAWYAVSARDLPWRRDREPYHVWLSEIMLQQTRVEAVKTYYERFLKALPTIEALASASDEQVHKLWEGLGYYNRARNLQKAAQYIMTEYGGEFPKKYEAIRALAGIGDYTAGAIGSICFELPTPAVDGNVLRVISRFCMLSACVDEPKVKKQVAEALRTCYPQGHCGEFTQSMMELGATVCLPNGAPKCGQCPLREDCRALKEGKMTEFPVRKQKKTRRVEQMTVFLLRCDGRLALCKRTESGLLAGLWEFPHVEGQLNAQQALDAVRALGCEPAEITAQRERIHVFTHVQWLMRSFDLTVREVNERFVWVTEEQLREYYALPTAFRQFIKES